MKKIKQLANNAFVRPDRTEVLTEELLEAERRIDLIRSTAEALLKKVNATLQGHSSSKDSSGSGGGGGGVSDPRLDKRIKKVPEFVLGSTMLGCGKSFISEVTQTSSVLGDVLSEAGQIEMRLGQAVVEWEVRVEDKVIRPLTSLLEVDLPALFKLKRVLVKLSEGMDVARAKHTNAARHSLTSDKTASAIKDAKEELEESMSKVEHARDQFTTEMYSVLAREEEMARWVADFVTLQAEYHSSVASILTELMGGVEGALAANPHRPVFGVSLNSHLQSARRSIAYPVELCVCALISSKGMEEEGLFRMAGSASKVKKLKTAFDAGAVTLESLLAEEERTDPHVLANVLKSYLRELPEPLLTFDLHDEWVSAVRSADHEERLRSLWTVVARLPEENKQNVAYLVRFLYALTEQQGINKMSAANIAIVIAPNLLWQRERGESNEEVEMGRNMTLTHLYSSVLDALVTSASYFFPQEIDFFVTCTRPPQENGDASQPHGQSTAFFHTPVKRSTSNSSVDDPSAGGQPGGHKEGSPKPVIRRKNKPAPVPPAAPVVIPSSTKVTSSATPSTPPGLTTAASRTSGSEKRDGMWIPPSPRETQRGKGDSATPPAKPPPPKSPLRHKNSFKTEKSLEDPAGQLPTPGPSAFCSLPRHFHTENSYKARPARPPSMFGVPPPAPPTVPKEKETLQELPKEEEEKLIKVEEEEQPKDRKFIGFEMIEKDLKEGDEVVEVVMRKKEEVIVRPVPAPRSSLLMGGGGGGGGERPQLMAKPRDLSRRTMHGSSGGSSQPDMTTEGSGSSSEDGNGGGNNGKPPRPQPPSNQNNKSARETTQL